MLVVSRVLELVKSHLAASGVDASNLDCRLNDEKLVIERSSQAGLVSIAVWSTGCCDVYSMETDDHEPRDHHIEFLSEPEAVHYVSSILIEGFRGGVSAA
jgi:hypothetical protein